MLKETRHVRIWDELHLPHVADQRRSSETP
jgi:hypothetical protein